jgi:hypothetical protein
MSVCNEWRKCANYDAWGYNCTYYQPDELRCFRKKEVNKMDKEKDIKKKDTNVVTGGIDFLSSLKKIKGVLPNGKTNDVAEVEEEV